MSARGCQRPPSRSSPSGTRRGGRAGAMILGAPRRRVWAALSKPVPSARGRRRGVAALSRPASTAGAQEGLTAAHGRLTGASAPRHRGALHQSSRMSERGKKSPRKVSFCLYPRIWIPGPTGMSRHKFSTEAYAECIIRWREGAFGSQGRSRGAVRAEAAQHRAPRE